MKHNIDEIRDELREEQKKLSNQEFVKKYGRTPDQLEALSDTELGKVAGGWVDINSGRSSANPRGY